MTIRLTDHATLATLLAVATLLAPAARGEPPPPPPTTRSTTMETTTAAPGVPDAFVRPPERIARAEFDRLPPHPRLFCDAAGWAALKVRCAADPTLVDALARLRADGDHMLAAPPVDYAPKSPGENVLKAIREAERRTYTFAALVRLTGEAKYLDGARRTLADLAAAAWTPSHYLDPATGCGTLGVGYDWLYAELSPAERDAYAQRIRGTLQPTLDRPQDYGFLWSDINWNQICNGGLVTGALATTERDPELSRHVANRAIAMIPRIAKAYAPDGIYPEGPGYWAYGTTYHVIQFEAYRSVVGDGRGLDAFTGFLASVDARQQLTGPSGEFFNFFDSHPTKDRSAIEVWFAREAGRPIPTPLPGDNLALAMIWAARDAHAAAAAPPAPLPLAWRGGGDQPVASLRTAWDDPRATWVAMKGGTPDHSHGHMDAGEFVLEADGVRWAIDPDIEDYLVVRRRSGMSHGEFFSYAQDSRRWNVLRLGADGHNVLRFDGARQRVAGHGTLGAVEQTPDGPSVEADLSSLYAGQVESAHRRVTLLRDGSVAIADTWRTGEAARDVWWQWMTTADVAPAPDGRSARLAQDGKSLELSIVGGDAGARLAVEDVSAPPDPTLDAPYPHLKRIVVATRTPAAAEGALSLLASPVRPESR